MNKLKEYERYLEEKINNPNYPDNDTLEYEIENDKMYDAAMQKQLMETDSDDYEAKLGILKTFTKEADLNQENYNFDQAVKREEKEELEKIILDKKEKYGIQDDLSVIKDNIIRYAAMGLEYGQIEIDWDKPGYENYRDFYRECVKAYTGEKEDNYEKDKGIAKGLSYTNPDLNNHGYINLLFMAIVLTAIAFIVLFKLF